MVAVSIFINTDMKEKYKLTNLITIYGIYFVQMNHANIKKCNSECILYLSDIDQIMPKKKRIFFYENSQIPIL